MSHANLEKRLRSHYSAVERRAVIRDVEFDPTPMLRTGAYGHRQSRWVLVGAAAAAVVTIGGIGYLSLRPDASVPPAQVPAPLPTLVGETEEQASFRIWSECMTEHGIVFSDSRGGDGGLEFFGPSDEATRSAVDECHTVLMSAGLDLP